MPGNLVVQFCGGEAADEPAREDARPTEKLNWSITRNLRTSTNGRRVD